MRSLLPLAALGGGSFRQIRDGDGHAGEVLGDYEACSDSAAAVDAIYGENTRLVGREGTTVSPLRPSGTMEIGGDRVPVGRRIFPGQLPLDQGHVQILHSISAARSRTSSLLAKQKRR